MLEQVTDRYVGEKFSLSKMAILSFLHNIKYENAEQHNPSALPEQPILSRRATEDSRIQIICQKYTYYMLGNKKKHY